MNWRDFRDYDVERSLFVCLQFNGTSAPVGPLMPGGAKQLITR